MRASAASGSGAAGYREDARIGDRRARASRASRARGEDLRQVGDHIQRVHGAQR